MVDRSEGTTRFTGLAFAARLAVPAGVDRAKAQRLLEKAERTCIVTNSLAVQPTLTCQVESA
jgi:organic hydroperoxide reductase OsmC/OhrA